MKFWRLTLMVFVGLNSGCATHSTAPVPSSGLASAKPEVIQHGGDPTNWESFAVPVAGGFPVGITGDIPGQIWFTENSGNSVDRLRIGSGEIRRFPLPTPKSFPLGIAGGPDGSIWFCEISGRMGRITQQGLLTEFSIGSGRNCAAVTKGSDGNIWFTDSETASIARITLTGGIVEFPIPSGSAANAITTGGDGNLWFSENASRVGKATINGVITEYQTLTSVPSTSGVTAASDGNVWFGETLGHRLGSVTPTGQLTEHFIPERDPQGLTRGGPSAELFVVSGNGLAEYNINSHHYTLRGFPPGPASTGALARGSDGNIWFTQAANNDVAVFIRHILTVSPTSLSLQVGQSGTLSASERGTSSPLQAKSSASGIATVTPAGSDAFTIKGIGSGTCTVTISDHKKNNFPVSVTVQ